MLASLVFSADMCVFSLVSCFSLVILHDGNKNRCDDSCLLLCAVGGGVVLYTCTAHSRYLRVVMVLLAVTAS